jgi:hypothetical protein
LTIGILSGYGESALDRVSIVCTLRVNSSNLFQPLPWNLALPVHPVTTEGESEAAVSGYQQASQSIPQTPPAAPQTGHLQIQRGLVRNRHIYSLVLSLMSTYTLSISCFSKSTLKVAQGKSSASPNSMVSGLCSVLITE